MSKLTQRSLLQVPLLLFFLLGSFAASARQTAADSLLHVLAKAKPDTAKVWLYFNLGRTYYSSDAEKALDYAGKALILAQELNFDKGKAKAVNLIGVCQLIQSKFDESLKSHYRALEIRERLRDTIGMMESLINLGNVNYRLTNTAEAVGFYKRALTYAVKKHSKPGLALLYNNLGSYYKDQWLTYKRPDDYLHAIRYIRAARKTKQELNDRKGQANCLIMLGALWAEKKNYRQALAAYQEALVINRNFGNKEGEVTALSQIADIYRVQNDSDQAIRYADSAYSIAKATKSDFLISNASETLQRVNSTLKNYKKAYDLLVQDKSRDSQLFAASRQKVREELAVKYQTAQKDSLAKHLKQESNSRLATILRKNEVQLQALLGIVVLTLLSALAFWSRHRVVAANKKLREQNRVIELNNEEISAQKRQIEQQAVELGIKNEALVTANMIRNKVFSVISHDLRSPLASLDSVLGLIKGGQLDRDEMEHFIGVLSDDIDITQKMLNSLLIWAGTQMDGTSARGEQVLLKNLVRENFLLSAKRALAKEIMLTHAVPPKAGTYTDREKLNFIVRNIISNAIKFTRRGGHIEVFWEQRKTGPVLGIRDNGIGMNAEAIASLFSDKRYSTVGTDQEKGTGLGMLLCKDFADSIGFRITVESQENKGTTFLLHFPQNEGETPVPVAAQLELAGN